AADQIREHYQSPDPGFQSFALALAVGREGAPTAETSLVALVGDSSQPAIARASALAMLGSYPPASLASPVRAATQSDSSLIRRAAAESTSNCNSQNCAAPVKPLLSDPVRSVRIAAAESLDSPGIVDVTKSFAGAFEIAKKEYVAAQELNADRPEAHV